MKDLCRDILTAAFLGFVLPGLLVGRGVQRQEAGPKAPSAPVNPVTVRTGDAVTEMALEDYITGVVLAEMPASFAEEALKTQAVAARTYTRKAMDTGGKHGDGSLCTDSTCCQAYISREDYLRRGREADADKVLAACADTAGQVLTYGQELIEATFFSCAAGATESALAVWGSDVPYLQSVPSPEDSGFYDQRLTFSREEFSDALGLSLTGPPEDWVTLTTHTQGGGVAAMTLGGQVFTGTQLRQRLGLRSTAFTLEAEGEGITVTTRGYGHRVGLSQLGAETMAQCGSTYKEILAHYYPGTELQIPQ